MKKLKLVRQGDDYNCGQCCVATLTGQPLEAVFKAVGKKGYTRTHHIIKGLTEFGIECDDTYTLGDRFPKDGTAVIRFTNPERTKAHWIVYYDKKYYDPRAGVFKRLPKYLKDSDITSFLQVYM